MSETILEVKSLKKYFPIKKSIWGQPLVEVKAVDDVSFSIKQGETFGIVGESGCGKSTLGRTIIRLSEPTSGEVNFLNQNFLSLTNKSLRDARKQIQMIFQDPYSSLDPRMNVGQILIEPLEIHNIGTKKDRENKVKHLLEIVGLKPQDQERYPHEFSGGQKQRICIARALALEPSLIICDEPVSALDVSIQAQTLNLMKDLQKKFNLTYIFISHDLSVVEHICDRVGVMYLGKMVEIQNRENLFKQPEHPYTKALLNSIPKLGVGKIKIKKSLGGEVPSPLNPPSGCSFHPRCFKASEKCKTETPTLKEIGTQSLVSCWHPLSKK